MKKIEDRIIIINKQTELGQRVSVQDYIHEAVTNMICLMDFIKPKYVFTESDEVSNSYIVMYVKCSNETYGAIMRRMNEYLPNVCLFEMY